MWPFRNKTEERGSLENPLVPITDAAAVQALFPQWISAASIEVTVDRALGVPAVWCGTNFISGTIAALPLQLFKTTDEGRLLAKADPLYSILHDVVNEDGLTSFKWRKLCMQQTLLTGRSYTFIERNKAGRVMNLWPLVPGYTTVHRKAGKTTYEYREPGASPVIYDASEIIDIPFMLASDGVQHINPTERLRNAIGLAIAMEEYASRFFQNGGVPPLAMQGPPSSEDAVRRAKANVDQHIRRSNAGNANIVYMPIGFRLDQVGFNPKDGQLIEARLFQLQEVARIYGLPPKFLHDLSHGTYTNTEQQDLAFVKHALTQWLELWEQELNAKLFSRRNRQSMVEFNIDGLLRGDFSTRMSGYATAIQNAIMTPDEARDSENRPRKGGTADELHIQGATVPLGQQNMQPQVDPSNATSNKGSTK